MKKKKYTRKKHKTHLEDKVQNLLLKTQKCVNSREKEKTVFKDGLLIAVNECADSQAYLGLSTPPNDVEAMKEILLNPEFGNFNHVETLINPNVEQFCQKISDFFSDRQSDDILMLYFSGYAEKDTEEQFYFATKDTHFDEDGLVFSSVVSAKYVNKILNSSKSQHKFVIIDASYSEAFIEKN
jgi:hypothetical protein